MDEREILRQEAARAWREVDAIARDGRLMDEREILRQEAARAWREVDAIARERDHHHRRRKELADGLGEAEKQRDVLARTVNAQEAALSKLRSVAEMMDAALEGAATEFVRVPYGASHEDVAAINDWHKVAAEARAEFRKL